MIESKARLLDIARDWKTGKFRLTFELDTFNPNTVNGITDKDLRLSVKRWRQKKTLTQNGYLWELLGKMAMKLNTSPEELHDLLLQRYGFPDKDEDGNEIIIALRSDIDVRKLSDHWKYIRASKDGRSNIYIKIKGTSAFDTAEMAYYLDRVIEEAKEMGIQTETPNQRAEAERWLTKRAH